MVTLPDAWHHGVRDRCGWSGVCNTLSDIAILSAISILVWQDDFFFFIHDNNKKKKKNITTTTTFFLYWGFFFPWKSC